MRTWLEQEVGLSPALQSRLLATLLIVGGLWLIQRIILALAYRRAQDPWLRYRWRKSVNYLTMLVGLVLIGRIWVAGVGSLATFLGLFAAGLAVALKDIVANLAGWAFIVWSRPFDVGDRIQVGAHAGDVIDLHLFQFTLNEIGNWVDADQSSGRIVHVPNGTVLSQPVANYDKGFRYIWSEIPVTITFESNWKKAKGILESIAGRHAEQLTEQVEKDLLEASRRYLIAYTKLTPIVYVRVADHGIRLTLRYLIRSRFRRGSENAIWQDVLDAFAVEPDIDFAYPTTRQVVREKH
ncbi:MAG TPA: mechanosensitive ion channel family protein [Gemmatimonadales bacterium]|nr:mechanosensitive ion channel family protein [Gemmatimonadales bacterium]